MNQISYKTQSLSAKQVQKKWVLVDAKGQKLGRMASQVAAIIRGKHNPGFTPHIDCGDNVIVINAAAIVLTGKKWDDKQYISHTGYPGGQKSATPKEIQAKLPTRLVSLAVKGMLPKNKLGRKLFNNLFVYKGAEHDKCAQKPQKINLSY